MMKKLFFAVSMFALAYMAAATARELDPEMVRIPGEGKLVLVNAAGVDEALLKDVANTVGNFLSIETEVRTGAWAFSDAKKIMADMGATAAVFVAKDANLPLSLIAMEEKWGMANAAGLTNQAIRREALRVAIVVIGGASSKYPASAMRPVFSAADLEKSGDMLTIDSLMAIIPNLKDHGLKPFEVKDYYAALEEGCTLPPANDAQRKIKAEWEKNRAAAKTKGSK